MNDSFEGKVALVTGGSSGIGRAAAIAFARRQAAVVIAARGAERGRRVVEEISAQGGIASFVSCDVSRSPEVERLVAAVIERHGRLDCAFNNAAGIEGVQKSTAEFSEEEYDRSMTVNLKSVWLCMKAEIAQMLAQSPRGGAIVNTSSLNGLGGAAGGSLYSAAKAGVLALTKSAAQEYAKQGIRVNALAAGAFRTPMLEEVMEKLAGGDAERLAAVNAAYAAHIPLGRIGNPEEAAEAVVWLCSDAASYVTGNSMIVDGGWTAPVR